jgi:hypothetical protein
MQGFFAWYRCLHCHAERWYRYTKGTVWDGAVRNRPGITYLCQLGEALRKRESSKGIGSSLYYWGFFIKYI